MVGLSCWFSWVVDIKRIHTHLERFKNHRIDPFSYLVGFHIRTIKKHRIDPFSYLGAGFVTAQKRASIGEAGADVEGACLAFAASAEAASYMRGVACLAKVLLLLLFPLKPRVE